MDLEPEHEELLALLVKATRAVPRHARHPFVLAKDMDGQSLIHNGLPRNLEVSESDLKDLVETGLLRRGMSRKGTSNYEVRQGGFSYYDQLKRQRAGQVERTEGEVRRYLDFTTIPNADRAVQGCHELWHLLVAATGTFVPSAVIANATTRQMIGQMFPVDHQHLDVQRGKVAGQHLAVAAGIRMPRMHPHMARSPRPA
jgi:hypothetical protein